MSILNNYQIRFGVKKSFNQEFKTINTLNDVLTSYITEFNTVNKVDVLLSGINGVISGIYPLAGGGTQSLYLGRISINQTKIYSDLEAWEEDNNIEPDFELPTSHFKIIVEAWKNYIE